MNLICKSPFDTKIKELNSKPRLNSDFFQIFPGLINDVSFAKLATQLVCDLTTEFPNMDWSPCLTVPGYWPTPRGGIARGRNWTPTENYLKALRMMGRIAYESRIPGSVSIKSTSNTSLPVFTSNLEYKKMVVDFWINHGEEIYAAAERKSVAELLDLPVPIVYGGSVGYRRQADSFKELSLKTGTVSSFEHKVREVYDFMGELRKSDKTIRGATFNEYRWMQAPRARQVAQESQTVNLPNVFFYKEIQRGLFNIGKPVWKNREGSANAARLDYANHKHLLKLDVKELDRHLIFPVLEAIRLGYQDGGCDPRWIDHLRHTVHGPMLCFKDEPDFKGWSWTYNPAHLFEAWKDNDYGMPSGFAGVSPEDKIAFTMQLFVTLVDIGHVKKDFDEKDITRFINNEIDGIRLVNSGDDTVLAFKSASFKQDFLVQLMKCGMAIEEEERISFLGTDFIPDGDRLLAIPQLVNSLKNILVPEHPWGGARRPVPGFGLIERNKYYALNPAWPAIWHRLNQRLAELNLPRLDDYIADGSNPENRAPVVGDMLNMNDITFILNPDSINYKLMEEDVSKELRDLYFLTYTEEDARKMAYLWEGR